MNFLKTLKSCLPGLVTTHCTGLSKIPKTGPVLLVGDHPNILDGLILAVASPRPVRILVAAELCSSPLVERLVKNLGWLPVERHKRGENGAVLQSCLKALEKGEVVALFPEGRTNYGKELLPFQPGAALLARRSGVPVVCFSVSGTERLFPDDSKVFHRGSAALNFGEAMQWEQSSGRLPENLIQETLEVMREKIAALKPTAPPLPPKGSLLNLGLRELFGAAVVKALSLSLLTVKWN